MVKAQRIDGADLSHWQGGTLNFTAAKHAGVRFVVHKATEGTGYTDPNFAKRATQVRGAGLVFGAYHFADPAGSAEAQAAHFLAVAKPVHGDLRPMLDFEDAGFAGWSAAKKTAFVKTFVAAVKKATGVEPFVYLPGTWALTDTFDCPLWVPRYSSSNAAPKVPRPWKTWTVWQFSDGAYGVPRSVAGLGNVDLNTVNMPPAEFMATFVLGAKREVPVKYVTKVVHAPAVQAALDALKGGRDNATKAGAPKRASRLQQLRNHIAALFPGVKKKVKQ